MARAPLKSPRHLSFLQLLPNLLTVGAICAGLTAMRFAFQGYFEMSVALVALAAALDGIDGRIARLLKIESAIGAELDSLADFMNFGVAPGVVVYLWALQDARSAGWICVLIFAVCCVLRLARFNVSSKSETGSDPRFFVGVPAPAGGLLAFLPFYVDRLAGPGFDFPPLVVGAWLVLVGLLMISRMPTPSLKSASVPREYARFALVGFVVLIAGLLTYPWRALAVLSLAYLSVVGWSALRAWRRRKRPEE